MKDLWKNRGKYDNNYIVRDREAGNIIESNLAYSEALSYVQEAERQDKKDGIYEPDFYEVVSE